MRYEYTYRNTPGDYWKFRMENYYRNWTALVSIVFTLSILALIIAKWNATNGLGKALMVIFLLVFPLFQPLYIYLISIRDAQALQVDTTLSFDETGMEIKVQKHLQRQGTEAPAENCVEVIRAGRKGRRDGNKP